MRTRVFVIGLGLMGIGCRTEHVFPGYLQDAELTSGAGSVTANSTPATPATAFAWISPVSPYLAYGDFEFDFGSGDATATLTCPSVPFIRGTPILLAQLGCSLCVYNPGLAAVDNGACATLGSGTLLWHSDLDGSGNGSAAVELNDTEQLPPFGTPPLTLSITLQALTGVAWFANETETCDDGFGPPGA